VCPVNRLFRRVVIELMIHLTNAEHIRYHAPLKCCFVDLARKSSTMFEVGARTRLTDDRLLDVKYLTV
jgi:hypothetical protein